MTLRFGLNETTIQKICGVLAQHPPVEKAVLYGSRAKGNYKNGSDIDLTLHGGPDLTLRVLYAIMDELDDLLLPYTIDLSIYATITDPEVRDHIERRGVIFYKRDVAIQTPARPTLAIPFPASLPPMDALLPPTLKVDRTALSVRSLLDESDEKAYWLSQTPHDRLRHMEILRRINYGHHATARLQRVLEFAQR